jgi:hypothetical protein
MHPLINRLEIDFFIRYGGADVVRDVQVVAFLLLEMQ